MRSSGGRRHWLRLGALCGLGLAWPPAWAGASASATVGPHPRLLATQTDWQALRQRLRTEPELAVYHAALIEHAQALLEQAPLQRKLVGRRMLAVSRSLQQRLWLWAYAWQTTGQAHWVQRASLELQTACAFSDWNPAHFLDVAEACAAVAVAYDWLYPALDATTRQACEQGLVRLALEPAMAGGPHTRWMTAQYNWNQVCFGGLVLGALALWDVEPVLGQRVLQSARQGIHHGLSVYAPDGVYPEGPSYWAYGTAYQVLMIAALRSALGSDDSLAQTPGFLPSAQAYVQLQGPSGRTFNFADGDETAGFESTVFWFAQELNRSALLGHEMARLQPPKARALAVRHQRMAPLAALWWPRPSASQAPLPTQWSGQGACPVWVWRERWDDPQALFIAAKGGSAALNHAHMDAGSFVLERDGVRWAVDLGKQDYESLESRGVDLWNKRQNSPRWQVFRLSNAAHNTLSLGDAPHRVEGHATLSVLDAAQGPGVELDCGAALGGAGIVARRRIQVQGRSVRVRDRVQGLTPGAALRWQLVTRAQAQVQEREVLLRQGGRTFSLRDQSAGAHQWVLWSAAQPEPAFNAPNPGVTVVQLHALADARGEVDIEVLLGG